MLAVRNSWYDISQATFGLWFYPNRKILIILMTSQQWWLFECWYETIRPTPTTWGNTFLWMHQTGTRKNPCYLFVFYNNIIPQSIFDELLFLITNLEGVIAVSIWLLRFALLFIVFWLIFIGWWRHIANKISKYFFRTLLLNIFIGIDLTHSILAMNSINRKNT